MVRGVLASFEEGEEGAGSGSCGWHVLPLLGDGDAIGKKAEGLRAPEGEKAVLDGWFLVDGCARTFDECGVVERLVLEVGEVREV